MKLLLAFLLLSTVARSQSCPIGQSWMPAINIGNGTIITGKCQPDSMVASLWAEYFYHLTPKDTTTLNYYTTFRILRFHSFDSTGWVAREVYQEKSSIGWTTISKCLYYWQNKSRLKCFGGWNQGVEISCCGHYHKVKPK